MEEGMQVLEVPLKTSERTRELARQYYQKYKLEDPAFMHRNRERVRLWRAQNPDRSRALTRAIMQRLRAEQAGTGAGAGASGELPPRRRSTPRVLLVAAAAQEPAAVAS